MRQKPAAIAFSAASVTLLALAAGAGLGLVALAAAAPSDLDGLRGLTRNPWWFVYAEGPDGAMSAGWRIAAAGIASLVSLGAVLRARSVYRRSPSPIIPFLVMFLVSLGLESLRAGTALLAATDGSIGFSVLLTRVIYWGRFVGLLGLLVAALYCLEMKYSRILVLGGMVLIVSFAMAAYVPIDRTVFLAQLTWKLGDEQSVWFLNVAIEALTVLTCLAAVVMRRGPMTLRLAGGIALFIVTRGVEFFALQPAVQAAGLLAQAAGAFLCFSPWAGEARSTRRPPA